MEIVKPVFSYYIQYWNQINRTYFLFATIFVLFIFISFYYNRDIALFYYKSLIYVHDYSTLLGLYAWFAFPWLFMFLIYDLFNDFYFLRDGRNLIILILAPLAYAICVEVKLVKIGVIENLAEQYRKYYGTIWNWLIQSFVLIGLSLLLCLSKSSDYKVIYRFPGIKKIAQFWYFFLLVPVIVVCSSGQKMSDYYPFFKIAERLPYASIFHYLFLELSYCLNIIGVEFFFRGILIFAFSRKFGIQAILPASVFYFVMHLGKPPIEALSSFAGGLFLGILAFNIKSVWIGAAIHLCLAMLIELFFSLT